jgi:hypothetical protein
MAGRVWVMVSIVEALQSEFYARGMKGWNKRKFAISR